MADNPFRKADNPFRKRADALGNEIEKVRNELRAEGVPESQIQAMSGVAVSDIPPGAAADVVNALRRSGAYQRRPAEESRNLGRAAAVGQGVGFESMDGAIGLTQPQGFMRDVAVDEVRQLVEDLPLVERLALQATGGLLTAGGAAGVGVTLARPGLTAAGKVGAAIGEGAGYGALYGLGGAEGGPEERALGAVTGGALGAVAGGAMQHILNKTGQAWGSIKNGLLALTGHPQQAATARAVVALEQMGMKPDQIAQRLDELGPEAMVMDLGEQTRALGRGAANVSPVAREALETQLSARAAGRTDRLTDSLLRAADLDEPKALPELLKAIRTEAKPAIDAAYAEARSLGNDIDLAAFDDIAQVETVSVALEQGRKAARDRMVLDAAKNGVPLEEGAEPSALAVLDETKKIFDDMAEVAMREGEMSKAQTAGDYAEVIRHRVDDWMTEYADARGLARNMFRRLDDTQLGAEAAKPRPPADIARRVAAAENPADVAKGYAAGKVDQLETRRSTPGVVDSVFGSKRARSALAAALGPRAKEVEKAIDAERVFGATERSIQGNSSTARQLLEMGALPAGAGAGIGYLYDGRPAEGAAVGLAAALLRRGAGGAFNAIRGGSERRTANEMANILMQRGITTQAQQKLLEQHILRDALSRASAGQAGANSPF